MKISEIYNQKENLNNQVISILDCYEYSVEKIEKNIATAFHLETGRTKKFSFSVEKNEIVIISDNSGYQELINRENAFLTQEEICEI